MIATQHGVSVCRNPLIFLPSSFSFFVLLYTFLFFFFPLFFFLFFAVICFRLPICVLSGPVCLENKWPQEKSGFLENDAILKRRIFPEESVRRVENIQLYQWNNSRKEDVQINYCRNTVQLARVVASELFFTLINSMNWEAKKLDGVTNTIFEIYVEMCYLLCHIPFINKLVEVGHLILESWILITFLCNENKKLIKSANHQLSLSEVHVTTESIAIINVYSVRWYH